MIERGLYWKSDQTLLLGSMAEREGFEPSIELPLYTRSRRAPSTTRPPLRASSFQRRTRLTLKTGSMLPCAPSITRPPLRASSFQRHTRLILKTGSMLPCAPSTTRPPLRRDCLQLEPLCKQEASSWLSAKKKSIAPRRFYDIFSTDDVRGCSVTPALRPAISQ